MLDDNKLLTLPNGERLAIPPNVRILFEVETLKYATLATVSRCGMVWFNTDILAQSDIFYHYLERLKAENYDEKEIELDDASGNAVFGQQGGNANAPEIRKKCVSFIQHLFDGDASFVNTALNIAETNKDKHVMEFTRIRVLEASFALVRKGIGKILEWNESRPDFELSDSIMEKFITKWALISFNWGLAGDMKLGERTVFWNKLKESVNFTISLPETNAT